VAAALREQRPLLVLTGAFVLLGFIAEIATGLRGQMRLLGFAPSFEHFVRILALPLPIALAWGRLKVKDPDGVWIEGKPGWIAAWRRFRERYGNVQSVTAAVLAGLMIAININLYGAWKLAIPKVHPFDWDLRLSAVDQALHFGRLPWEWLRPLLGNLPATDFLDFMYYSWLPVLTLVCAWQAWSWRRDLRMRFFLTFILIWILLGDVAATTLSSAGPTYWAHVVGGPNPYQGLFDHLAAVAARTPLTTPVLQDALWSHYIAGRQSPYTGISAMPSIHVSMPVLYTLVGWRTWKPLGIAFFVYGVIILLGSVHLGWHYAVDGYVSIIGVLVLWWVAGRLTGAHATKNDRATHLRVAG